MLKPLHDYVLLKKEAAQTTTASGIILTTPKETAGNQATVVAVGPKCEEAIEEGMTVIFKEYSGTKYTDDDDEYMLIAEKDILAIVE